MSDAVQRTEAGTIEGFDFAWTKGETHKIKRVHASGKPVMMKANGTGMAEAI